MLLLPWRAEQFDRACWNEAFGLDAEVTAAIVASITCFVIVGGLRRIATFTSWVVPFMAQAYIVVALVIVGVNWEQIPDVMTLIVNSAFGFDSLTGGMLGAAIAWGVKRGIYSNEAGQVRARTLRRQQLFLTRPSRGLCRPSRSTSTRFSSVRPLAS